jgi:pyruvate dehydrogenase E2 component (dihydrolipoamide acetyltransferase)
MTAKEQGIPLDGIVGSGPVGRILKDDVIAAASKPKATPAAQAAPAKATQSKKVDEAPAMSSAMYEDIENSNIRKVIADRLTHSK